MKYSQCVSMIRYQLITRYLCPSTGWMVISTVMRRQSSVHSVEILPLPATTDNYFLVSG
jgi:hypothetical protein